MSVTPPPGPFAGGGFPADPASFSPPYHSGPLYGYPWPPHPFRPHQHRNNSVIIVIGVVIATLALGLPGVLLFATGPGIGPGIGAGATPLGTVLAISTPAPQSPDGSAEPQLCNYTMILTVDNDVDLAGPGS